MAQHATLVLERDYRASPERLFRAWADPAQRKRWDAPSGELVALEQDFRVGGRLYSRFGPKGYPMFWSEGHYLDIVENARIVSATAMHMNELRSSTTMTTIEIGPHGGGARLVLTDQSVYLAGETPAMREQGWTVILASLETYLNA